MPQTKWAVAAASPPKAHAIERSDRTFEGEQPGACVAWGQFFAAFDPSDGFGLSDLGALASLLMLPFAHQDLAIVFGAYAIVNKWLPASLVALCIYGGMVASDFALYGIGAGARWLPWLNRYAVDERVVGFGQNIKRNLFGVFALCRLVPGVVFVAFVACGWMRVSLGRFTVASLLISALYLPIVLYLVIVFGDALDDHVGLWSWPMLLAVLIATAFVRRRVFGFNSAGEVSELAQAEDKGDTAHRGTPPLSLDDRRVARTERIPSVLLQSAGVVVDRLRVALWLPNRAGRGQSDDRGMRVENRRLKCGGAKQHHAARSASVLSQRPTPFLGQK